MNLAARLATKQAPVFRLGHVIHVLQMAAEDLDEHLLRTARDNPFLIVRQRRGVTMRAGGVQDLIDTSHADAPNGLYDHATRELAGLIARGGPMQRLVMALIEELEPTGWLGCPVADIAARLALPAPLVEEGLRLVQRRVSPTGLFARTLKECLRLQMEEMGLWGGNSAAVLDNLEALEHGGVAGLARAASLTEAAVAEQLAHLRRLDPKPGSRFDTDPALMREADVRIEARGDGWHPVFRSRLQTEVTVNLPTSGPTSPALLRAIAEARALKTALDLRTNALRHIVQVMIEVQGDFFRDGEEALRPLSQADIARRTGFHFSTVSRVLNGLLIEGPQGIIDARVLCARRPGRDTGDGLSKPKVLARLKALVLAESRIRPLSDLCLAECLCSGGMKVSRRVVAKYRQELGFAPAAQRRTHA